MGKVFAEHLGLLVESYKNDPESDCNTWFVGSIERLKAFRSIRRGVEAVVRDIQTGLYLMSLAAGTRHGMALGKQTAAASLSQAAGSAVAGWLFAVLIGALVLDYRRAACIGRGCRVLHCGGFEGGE